MKYPDSFKIIIVPPLILLLLLFSCKMHYVNPDFRQTYQQYNELLHSDSMKTSYLKVHTDNGNVYLLEDWDLNESGDMLTGVGKGYNYNRMLVTEGSMAVPVNSIVILETNDISSIKSLDGSRKAGLAILTIGNIIGGILCAVYPKACWGSCPTFYIDQSPGTSIHRVSAEAFSRSVRPSLEQSDIDALQYRKHGKQLVNITMTNEAYETHAVNMVNLLAVPAQPEENIFHDKDGTFYRCNGMISPSSAFGPEGPCLEAISAIDDLERISLTDSTDLTEKEIIELEFTGSMMNNPALVMNFRQTLLTTFLIYSGISYMGNEISDVFTVLETNDKAGKTRLEFYDRISTIEIWIQKNDKNRWERIDQFTETGPIAKNLQIIPLCTDWSNNSDIRKVRICMTRGMWKLDFAGLVNILDTVEPMRLLPKWVSSYGMYDEDILEKLSYDDDQYLASLSGDRYELSFLLPDNDVDYELFLLARGYYLEWARQEWYDQKDLTRLRKLLTWDQGTMEAMAREYKNVEGIMESVFWNSKIVLP